MCRLEVLVQGEIWDCALAVQLVLWAEDPVLQAQLHGQQWHVPGWEGRLKVAVKDRGWCILLGQGKAGCVAALA